MTSVVPEPDDEAVALLKTSRSLALLAGAVSLIAGVILLGWPRATIKAIALVVGILLIVRGFVLALDALSSRKAGSWWGLAFLRGLVDIAAGIVCITWPAITVWALVVILGIEFILGGLIAVLVSMQVPKDTGQRHLFPGIVSIIAGVVVIAWPAATLWVLVVVTGFYLIAFGILSLFLGFQIGRAERFAAGPAA